MRVCVSTSHRATSSPAPHGRADAAGVPMHVLHEDFMSRLQPTLVGDNLSVDADVHVMELIPVEGQAALGHVVYVRLDSDEWRATPDMVWEAVEAVCARMDSRDPSRTSTLDGADMHSSPASGYYVATGSATRGQRRTKTLPRGTRRVAKVGGRTAPYSHANAVDPRVRRVCAKAAPLMGAAAQVLRRHARHVYDSMWAHARAHPLMGVPLIYPSARMQDGVGTDEFAHVQDNTPHRPAIPTQHIAVRVAGAREGATKQERLMAADGVSPHHIDTMDSKTEHGHPIVFVPHITRAARAKLRGRLGHPLPASDLVLAEGPCVSRRGDRAWRIITCTDGWACIVVTHFNRLMHGNVYPCGRNGNLMDREGVPYLARSTWNMPPGVQLARIVCYNTSDLDSFAKEAQMAWNACRTDSDRGALALAIYEALDAPLDARFLAGLSEGRGEAGG